MDIKTKFKHSDRVQAITHGIKEVKTTCDCCNGSGNIQISNYGENQCPKCYGKGFTTSWEDEKWYVPSDYYNFVIQKIGMELYNPNNKKYFKSRSWIYYMADSSGTMFDEKDCFASIEEAQQECDKRNKE